MCRQLAQSNLDFKIIFGTATAFYGKPMSDGKAQVVSCQTEPSQTFESLQFAAAQTAEFIAEIELKK